MLAFFTKKTPKITLFTVITSERSILNKSGTTGAMVTGITKYFRKAHRLALSHLKFEVENDLPFISAG